MKQKNYEKGITLIALVVTIIILLILAGVTTYILINQGIIDKSEIAVDEYKISEYKDNIEVIKTGEHIKKISDKLPQSLKDLVTEKLKDKENESWVEEVETSEEDAGLEEDQIKVITKDGYIIVAEIEEDGTIIYITIDKDNGEPYPSLEVEVLPLEGTENEKVKIQVKAEVEKIGKTKKIAKIELIKDGKVIETRNYNDSKVEDIFEVEENGTYRIKAITDQEKSTTKKAIVNIIQITSEPTTARNTETTGTKNGIATGPITVTITYGNSSYTKQYKVGSGTWQTVSGTSTNVTITTNTTIIARYYDGTNGFETESYNIQNVDNVAPTFTNYNATASGTTITATATVTDTASEGAASGIAGVESVKYSIDGKNYQDSNTFKINAAGDYTIYIKAIDKAGNEKIVNKTVTVKGYTISYNANGGSGAPENQTKLEGENLILSSTIPKKSGYAFAGWSENDDTIAEYTTGSIYSADKDIYLYAVWVPSTQNFEASGGKGLTLTFGNDLLLPKGTKVSYSLYGSWTASGQDSGHSIFQTGGFDASQSGRVYSNKMTELTSSNSFTISEDGGSLYGGFSSPSTEYWGTSGSGYYVEKVYKTHLTVHISN